jgi:dipeptidyl aminopeptidase/acylaminoacyl peptidase
MSTQPLDFERLMRVPYINPDTGFEISPDGRFVAFSWNRSGQWEIYQLRLDHPDDLRQITSGPGAKFRPRYSPDNLFLCYALDLDGSESFDICVCNLAQKLHFNLTPATPFAIQPNVCWSSDGKSIAIITNQSGRFSTYILPLAFSEKVEPAAAPQLIFDRSGPHEDVLWSPDGSYLAVVCESTASDYATYIVPVPLEYANDNRRVQPGERILPKLRIISEQGEPINAKQVCWSPDGARLAFSSDLHGNYDIGIFELSSGQVVWVTSGKGDKGFPDWSADGKRLTYVYCEGPDSWVAVLELGRAAPALYHLEPGVHASPLFTPDSRRIVFAFDNPRRPDDLWLLNLESGQSRSLTHSLPPEFSPEEFIMPRHIEYPSLDGRSVPALLYQPDKRTDGANQGLPPAVIVIHGGPTWLFQFLWYPLMTYLASLGYVVLAPNYRGSSGYGREWQLANRYDMGRGDTMDVAAGVGFLVKGGLADPARIAVTGRSHGGYLTMSCLTEYPKLWACGSAVVPFLNWFTSHANSRQDLQHWDIENMGDPGKNAKLWRERSPFFFLRRVQAPVQLICGANDPRCPASESSAARDVLLALGKPVDYVIYPDEGHAFLKIENVVDHELRRVAFLRRTLENKRG